MSHETVLRTEDCILVVVDVQERLLPAISGGDNVLRNCSILAQAAEILSIPVIVTEQYPKGLGATVDGLAQHISGAKKMEKMTFSCVGCDEFLDALDEFDRDQILLCGVETHVCVQQTALDLVENGSQVHLASDAVGSRNPDNHATALRRMEREGVVITSTESALFEMLEVAGTPEFKAVAKLVK